MAKPEMDARMGKRPEKSPKDIVRILESFSDGFFTLDENLRVTYFNCAAETLLKRKREEILGRELFDAFPEARGSIFEENYRRALQEKRSIVFETYFPVEPYKNWYEVRVYPYEDGIAVYFQVITDRKRAEESAERERSNLINLLQAMEDGVCVVDQQYNIQYANQSIQKDFGPYEGRKCYEYFYNRKPVCPWCKNEASFTGKIGRWEWRSEKTGKTYELIGTPLKNPEGTSSRLEIFRDITERRGVEEAIKKARDELEMTVRERTEALRASENMYKALFQNTKNGVAIYRAERAGADFIFVDFNRAAERILKRHKNNVVGRRSTEVFPRIREFGLLDALQKVWRTGIAQEFPVKKYIDGKLESWTENFIYRLPSGEIVAIVSDETERKRSEKALSESEQRLRTIAETITEVFWMTDAEISTVFYVSPAYERVWGRTVASLYENPRSFIDAIHEQDRERVIAKLEIQKAVQPFDQEYRIVRPDGTMRWIWDRGFPVRDETGEVTRYVGVAVDITERKEAEEALWKTQKRFELALTGADLGWWEWNVQTDEAIADWRGAEIIGYSLDEIESYTRLWEESIHPDDKAGAFEALKKHLHGHTALFETEHRLRTKSGEWKWVLVRGKIIERDATDKPLRLAGTFLDISDRKRAEEDLHQSEQRFRAIFEGAEDCIFLKDRSLRYIQVNPAAEKLAGLPASEIIGKKHEDVFGRESSEFIRDLDRRALGGEAREDELGKTAEGVPMTFLATRTPLRDASGEIVGLLTTLHDITDRKRSEAPRLPTEQEYPSKAMRTTLKQARIAANRASTILLTGESGSGKDHLAKYIHDHSDRVKGPYLSINCAAITQTLAESELFGHEKGAFTGAVVKKRGLLELAEGGTLLLNEIGDLSLDLQAKLLTFLDTKKFTRVGGEKEISVSARLIAATNKDLEKAVEEGGFRKDLFYRLNVVSIPIPPLRDRRDDIPVLVPEILAKIRDEMQIQDMPVIGPVEMDALKRYHWPGNVRELRNVLERGLILSHGKAIDISGLCISESETPIPESEIKCFSACFPSEKSLNEMTQELKRFMVNEALLSSGGSRVDAAKLLGISRHSLKHYMKTLGYYEEE